MALVASSYSVLTRPRTDAIYNRLDHIQTEKGIISVSTSSINTRTQLIFHLDNFFLKKNHTTMAAQEPNNVSLDLLVEPNPLFGATDGITLTRFMELDQNISYSTPDSILNDILDKPLITTGIIFKSA